MTNSKPLQSSALNEAFTADLQSDWNFVRSDVVLSVWKLSISEVIFFLED